MWLLFSDGEHKQEFINDGTFPSLIDSSMTLSFVWVCGLWMIWSFTFCFSRRLENEKEKEKKIRFLNTPNKTIWCIIVLYGSSISILPALFHDVPPLQVRVHSFVPFPVIFCLLLLFSSFGENNPKLTDVASFILLLIEASVTHNFWH